MSDAKRVLGIWALAAALAGGLAFAVSIPLARAAEDGQAVSSEEFVDDLFAKLREARDKDSAELLASAIRRVWLASGSDTVDLLIKRANDLMEARELDDALQILDTVVELAPDYAEGWNRRATAHFMMHQYGASISDIQKVLAIEPRHFGALAGLGTMLKDTDRKDAALEIYRRALEIHPFLEDAQKAVDSLEVEVEGREI